MGSLAAFEGSGGGKEAALLLEVSGRARYVPASSSTAPPGSESSVSMSQRMITIACGRFRRPQSWRWLRFMFISGLCLVGCAGPLPWKDAKQIALEKERYGLTADQRIKELRQQAQEARNATPAAQAAFTKELVSTMLAEHDPRVRARIIGLAAEFNEDAARAICVGGLDDPDAMVRMAACDAWVEIGGSDAVRHLANRYRSDDDIDVRLYALRAIGDLGDDEAVPVLAEALEAADPAVQYRAVAALKDVTGEDLGNDVNVWREWAANPDAPRPTWSLAEAWRKLF